LEGAFNFVPRKLRLQMLMEEADLLEHLVKVVLELVDLAWLVAHHDKALKQKCNTKET
jgi:hypothetical protein